MKIEKQVNPLTTITNDWCVFMYMKRKFNMTYFYHEPFDTC